MASLTIIPILGMLGILFIVFNVTIITLFILTIVFGIIRVVKKKFKKTFIVLLIITILFGVIDFFVVNNFINDLSETENEVNIEQKNGEVILSDNPIEQLFMSDDKKIEIISDDIIQKVETKDYETIKNVFSKDTINNVKNLDEGINELINISNEGIINVESQFNGSETHWDSGQHRKTYRFSCDITTNNTKYDIGFEYDYENPFNSETLGVNRMIIVDANKNTIILVENEEISKGY